MAFLTWNGGTTRWRRGNQAAHRVTSPRNVVIVLPCFNEEHRLRLDALAALQREPGIRLLFVDDGSSDGSAAMLRAHCRRAEGRAELLSLPKNQGKAEAVRAGMNRALAEGAAIVGYVDVDLSTPV